MIASKVQMKLDSKVQTIDMYGFNSHTYNHEPLRKPRVFPLNVVFIETTLWCSALETLLNMDFKYFCDIQRASIKK
jgi:hypothetical protein